MARTKRVHIPNAIHHVILNSAHNREIFTEAADYEHYLKLCAYWTRQTRARLYAYSLTPKEVNLAVQVHQRPLADTMRQIASHHARRINQKQRVRGHVFGNRFRTAILPSVAALPEVVRFIHLAPIRFGLADEMGSYRWTSHASYLGVDKLAWVHTSLLLRLLNAPDTTRTGAYRNYMLDEKSTAKAIADRECDQAMLGLRFLARLSPQERRCGDPEMFERIIRAVAAKMHVAHDELVSPSRRRKLSLARALIGWHSFLCEAATLTEVAAYFDRNPSSISEGIEYNRRRYPQLFAEPTHTLLAHHYVPIASLSNHAA